MGQIELASIHLRQGLPEQTGIHWIVLRQENSDRITVNFAHFESRSEQESILGIVSHDGLETGSSFQERGTLPKAQVISSPVCINCRPASMALVMTA